MKKIITLFAIFLLSVVSLFAQVPQRFSYQAVVRNPSNQLVSNAPVGIRVSILSGGASGNIVYSETHMTATNVNGLLTIEIGSGSVQQGMFSDIAWGESMLFLKTEIDPTGGNNYSITSVQQLLSVPYALYAKEAANSFSGDYNDLENKPQIPTVPTNISAFINDAGYLNSYSETDPQFNAWDKDYNDLINKPTIPTIPDSVSVFVNDAGYLTSYTEQQVLSISNDTIFLTGGSFVKLPAVAVGFNGDYNDLINKPIIPTVPDSVSAFVNDAGYLTSYTEQQILSISNDTIFLTGGSFVKLPAGFDGDYNSLSNKPVIPIIPDSLSAFVNDVGYLTSFAEQQILSISNDTIFLTGGSFVKLPAGFDGDYNSLSNKPVIPTVPTNMSAFNNDAGYLTSYTETDPQFNAWDKDYNDLINKPTIPMVPTNVSAFANDAGYLTAANVQEAANIPTNVSSFNNDAGYITGYTEQQVLSISNDTIFLTGGSFVKLPAGFDGDYNSLSNKPVIPTVPTNMSSFNNDIGYLTSYTETDPQFNAWDKDYNDLINKPTIPAVPTNVSSFDNDAGYLTAYTENQSLADVTAQGNSAGNRQLKDVSDPTESYDAVNLRSLNWMLDSLRSEFQQMLQQQQEQMQRQIDSLTELINAQQSDSSASADSIQALLPVLTTNPVTSITASSIICGGNVTSDGGATVTARGVCWSTTQNPTVNGNHTTDGTGAGAFISNITGLTPSSVYYVRAYATNSAGTAYGEELSFATMAGDSVSTGDAQPCPGTPTVTDIDGNIYNTVKIGNQCWMKENLRTTHFANGTSISLGNILSHSEPYRYYPSGNSMNVANYGYLYNWVAVMQGSASSATNPSGVQGICPTGWHVPSDAEWAQLTDYVSGQSAYQCSNEETYIAKALAATSLWNTYTADCAVGNDLSANNATGFSAVPAGNFMVTPGVFSLSAYFWSSMEMNNTTAMGRHISYQNVNVGTSASNKSYGFSVRCLRDDTSGGDDGSTVVLPTVTTNTVSDIMAHSTTCGGNVTADGGATVTARGVCWSTSQNPTVNDSHTADGSGTGYFTSNIRGLTPNTTYYVRAYATNSAGTSYGEQKRFTTIDCNAVHFTITPNHSCDSTLYLPGTGCIYVDYPHDDDIHNYTFRLTLPGAWMDHDIDRPSYKWCALSDNDYYVEIIDNVTGCEWHDTLTVPFEPVHVTMTPIITANNNCVGTGNGTITVNAVSDNYDSELYFSIDGGATWYENGGTVQNLSEGSYEIVIRDSYYNCMFDTLFNKNMIIITETPGPHTITTNTVTDAVAPNGEIHIYNTNPTYTYTLSGVTLQGNSSTLSFTGLSEGDYTIHITSSGQCTFDQDFHIYAASTDGQPCPSNPTVADHEGNVYNTVQIGNQCWTKENLRTTTSPSTGTYLIPAADANYTYTGKQARWCNNDSATYAPMNYGLLYNWNAAVDTFNTAYGETSVNTNSSKMVSVNFVGQRRGICPSGWHLPSDAELTALTVYVSGQSKYVCDETISYIAKSLADSIGWNNCSYTCAIGNNQSMNNATGFSALPAGCCSGSSFFLHPVGFLAYFWSSSHYESGPNRAIHRFFSANDAVMNLGDYMGEYYGFSVRCLCDDTLGGDGGSTSVVLPTVTTNTVSEITSTSATCGGNVTTDGGAAVIVRGVCWSTSQNPTVNDNHTADDSFTGNFTSNIIGLTPNTTYYVRAYAINAVGTVYGEEMSFTTMPDCFGNYVPVLIGFAYVDPARPLHNDCKMNIPDYTTLLSFFDTNISVYDINGHEVDVDTVVFYLENTDVVADGNPDIFADTDVVTIYAVVTDICGNISPKTPVFRIQEPAPMYIVPDAITLDTLELCADTNTNMHFNDNFVINAGRPYEYQWSQISVVGRSIIAPDSNNYLEAVVSPVDQMINTSTHFVMTVTDVYGCIASDTANAIHFYRLPNVFITDHPENAGYPHNDGDTVCPNYGNFYVVANGQSNLPDSIPGYQNLGWFWEGAALSLNPYLNTNYFKLACENCDTAYTVFLTGTNLKNCSATTTYTIHNYDGEVPVVISIDTLTQPLDPGHPCEIQIPDFVGNNLYFNTNTVSDNCFAVNEMTFTQDVTPGIYVNHDTIVNIHISTPCGQDIDYQIFVTPDFPLYTPVPEMLNDTTVCADPANTFTLSVANESATSTYEWFGSENVSVGTTATVTLPAGSVDRIRTFYVVETDQCGRVSTNRINVSPDTVASDVITVKVTSKPAFIFTDMAGTVTHDINSSINNTTTAYKWTVDTKCFNDLDTKVFVNFYIYHDGVLIPASEISQYLTTPTTTINGVTHSWNTNQYGEFTSGDGSSTRTDYAFYTTMVNHYPHSNLGGASYDFDWLYLHFVSSRFFTNTMAQFLQTGDYEIHYELYATDGREINYYYQDGGVTQKLGGHNYVGATLLTSDVFTIHVDDGPAY